MCYYILYYSYAFLLQKMVRKYVKFVFGVVNHLLPQRGSNPYVVVGKENIWRMKFAG